MWWQKSDTKLAPDSFLKKNWAYFWMNSLIFYVIYLIIFSS